MSNTTVRAEVANLVHQEMDFLVAHFSPLPDQKGQAEGDYTRPIDRAMRDLSITDLSTATNAQLNAVIVGTSYYVYRRVVNARSVNVTTAGGIGAGGRRDQDWNYHLREIKQILKQYRDDYEKAAAVVGITLSPMARATEGPTVRAVDDGFGSNLVSSSVNVGLPWFNEGYHEEDDDWHS